MASGGCANASREPTVAAISVSLEAVLLAKADGMHRQFSRAVAARGAWTIIFAKAPRVPVNVKEFFLPERCCLGVMSRDVVESVEGYAANRRVVSVVVVEVEPAGQRQASFGL